MYRVTLKEGKTYHVGGVTFTKGTPRVVSEELGEYLKTVDVFEVEEAAVLDDVDTLDGMHALDLVETHALSITPTSSQDYQPIVNEGLQARTQPETTSKGVIINGEGSSRLQRGKEHNNGGAEGSPSQHRGRSRKYKSGPQ